MKPIFKVGEKVRIADLQQLIESDVPYHVAPDMLSFSGMLAEITMADPDCYTDSIYKKYNSSEFPNYNKPDGCRYHLKLAGTVTSDLVEYWQWSSPMLKKVEEVEDLKANKDSNSPLKIKVTRKSIILNFKN